MHGQQNMKFSFHGHSSSMKIWFWYFFGAYLSAVLSKCSKNLLHTFGGPQAGVCGTGGWGAGGRGRGVLNFLSR